MEDKKSEDMVVSNRKLVCDICSEEMDDYQMVKLFVCHHLFCEDCISTFVEGKLKMHQLFDCPSCNSPYDQNSVFFLSLSLQEQEKLAIINLRKQLESNPNLRECPNEKCKLGVIPASPKQKTGICRECLKEYCLSCMLPVHAGKCASTGASLLRQKFNFKECPKCKRIIERIAGCPHITCPCGKQFCYNCLGNWNGYGHRCETQEEARRRAEAQRKRQEE